MRNKTGTRWKYLVFFICLALLLPEALAYTTFGGLGRYISPLDQGVRVISNVFNIQALRDTWVQTGFLKFMIFIVLFAVSNSSLGLAGKKLPIFDKKTAGIVSFAFSTIGVFMMPEEWLFATGATITALMSSMVFILVFIGGSWLAMFKLKPDGEDDKMGWLKNLLGLMLLFFLLFLIDAWAVFTYLPILFLLKEDWMRKIIGKR